ncbi:uncharacterized protein A1O9_09437 [Exophiala aquamarina CBS 119918]|uniref:Ubiquitin-like domain-containing protein n=1 Tax=Exophiala aquamarina CBS 119918 TaxID=1182545 RepID=A0A072P390_9EURO|nr:uncharacterized protein A1O9_09437 [Exophiala aquamarina CBS 119918]KEF54271.1 hypothetical protein A1O9_09437 [Exophiala aquamarina CBS 119918]
MQIFIRGLTEPDIITLEVESWDTIEHVYDQLIGYDFDDSNQFLTYGGKRLYRNRILADYNISKESTLSVVTQRLPRDYTSLMSSFPPETTELTDEATLDATRDAWKKLAKECDFDDDLHILDPLAYYSKLELVESRVVESSELVRSKGTYDFVDDEPHDASGGAFQELEDQHNMILAMILGERATTVTQPENRWQHIHRHLRSLYKTYTIVAQVSKSIEDLRSASMCGEFFSVLRYRKHEPELAELIRIPCNLIDGFRDALLVVLLKFSEEAQDDPEVVISANVMPICLEIQTLLELPTPSEPEALLFCRAIAFILDLALVSYVGSHAERFDLTHINKPLQDIFINGAVLDLFDVHLSLAGLACLDGFLNGRKVWVLSLPSDHTSPSHLQGKRLHILTKIDVFADVWGPVWTLQDKDSSEIKQFNLSTGVIIPKLTRQKLIHLDALPCHWYSSKRFLARKYFPSPFRGSSTLTMALDSLLLIGNNIRENNECDYMLNDFQADYEDCFKPLEVKEGGWAWDTRGVQTSFGFSKIVTGSVGVSGTQKRQPAVTRRQAIISKWKNKPEKANAAVLNLGLAVEISHCTGNARRISLRKLLTLPIFWNLLDQQSPRWWESPWGERFKAALESDSDKVIVDVFKQCKPHRKQMADLVCSVLELLDDTGYDGDRFTAAFLNNNQECLIDIEPKKNEWMKMLGSSPYTTAYSFINNVCLECHTPDHSTATHDSNKSYTVLQTRIWARSSFPDTHHVKVKPHEQTAKILDRSASNGLFVTPDTWVFSAISMFNPYLPVVCELFDRSPLPVARANRAIETYVRASSKSFGGMKFARDRTPVIDTAVENAPQENAPPLNAVPDNARVLFSVALSPTSTALPLPNTLGSQFEVLMDPQQTSSDLRKGMIRSLTAGQSAPEEQPPNQLTVTPSADITAITYNESVAAEASTQTNIT